MISKKIWVALDTDDISVSQRIMRLVGDLVRGFKLGPRFCLRVSPADISVLSRDYPIFLDFKFFDIPSTTCAAVQSAFELGAEVVTIHGMNSSRALCDVFELQEQLRKECPLFRVLPVTILTSWDVQDVEEQASFFMEKRSVDHALHLQRVPGEGRGQLQQVVKRIASRVHEVGFSGVVASADEAYLLKKLGLTVISPGITWDQKFLDSVSSEGLPLPFDDQKRAFTFTHALNAGVDEIVMGRSLLSLKDPRVFLENLNQYFDGHPLSGPEV